MMWITNVWLSDYYVLNTVQNTIFVFNFHTKPMKLVSLLLQY